jgi:phenylacetate-CoA ligase
MFDEGASALGCTVIPSGVGNTETQAEIIKNLGVQGYIGTPSFLLGIINKAESLGVDVAKEWKMEVSLLLAEMLPESTRKDWSMTIILLDGKPTAPRMWDAYPTNVLR